MRARLGTLQPVMDARLAPPTAGACAESARLGHRKRWRSALEA